MFPLAGTEYPTSLAQLVDALRAALTEMMSFPNPQSVIKIEGGAYPSLDRVTIDLSGGKLRTLPPPPKEKGGRQPGPRIANLRVIGHSVYYEKSKAELELMGSGVKLDFARTTESRPMLVLADAQSGQVGLGVCKDDLQSLFMAIASTGARQQGVTIQELQANLVSEGPRSLAAEARIKAKKMMMSGTVTVRGRMDIQDDLTARLSGLSCTGEGMIGGMAAAMLQQKLNQLDSSNVPLTTFSLGDLRLHDLQISTTDGLHVAAQFGKA